MYKDKISAVYKIVNTVTGEFYIGSSKHVKKRWLAHKNPSRWKENPNNKMYQDMQEYGLDKFSFEILKEVEPENLRQAEQKFIDMLKPTYNTINAKGENMERLKVTRNKACKKYYSQLCEYNGETLTLKALFRRFQRAGIPHPTLEAKKYLTTNKIIY